MMEALSMWIWTTAGLLIVVWGAIVLTRRPQRRRKPLLRPHLASPQLIGLARRAIVALRARRL